jgi:hypothetical protein
MEKYEAPEKNRLLFAPAQSGIPVAFLDGELETSARRNCERSLMLSGGFKMQIGKKIYVTIAGGVFAVAIGVTSTAFAQSGAGGSSSGMPGGATNPSSAGTSPGTGTAPPPAYPMPSAGSAAISRFGGG